MALGGTESTKTTGRTVPAVPGQPPRSERKNKGGRKPGLANVTTRKLGNEIAADPHAPLRVMFENLKFWHLQAEAMTEELKALVVDIEDPEARKDAMKKLGSMLEARNNAQRCAVDLAPYVHPRLATIEWRPATDEKPQQITGDMTPQQAAEAYASSLKG